MVEVYYSTKTAAYDSHSKIFGYYTVSSETVNDRYFYQSNFENGKYGIWWCGRVWSIAEVHLRGQCIGNAGSLSSNFCLEEIGWNWEYAYGYASLKKAKEGLGIRCICSNSDSRGNFIYTDQSQLNHTNWVKDEPNNNNCQENCAIMQLNNGKWNDEDCRKKHGFICQSEKSSDQIIQFRHKEFVALKNDSFVEILIDRLFVSWDQAVVKWEVTNKTAICSQDIKECNGTIFFNSGESTTKLEIPIFNGSNFKERSFHIKLILLQNSDYNIKLGNINKTLVRIISGNGTIQFDRKSYIGSENCGFVMISVLRLYGSSGEVSVQWKTNGYSSESGSQTFYNGEHLKTIQIDIIDDNEYKPDETFELELFQAKNGAKLGDVDKTKITIEDNDSKKLYSNQTLII